MGNKLEFAGKVALITGGNSGIGAAAARRVAELGAQVALTGRRQREGRLLVNDIKRNGGSAAFIQADLSQPEQVKRIVPFTVETFGRLDYAFNNAGISGENRLLTDQTEKSFDRVFAVNVKDDGARAWGLNRQYCLSRWPAGVSNRRPLRGQQTRCAWLDQDCRDRMRATWYSGERGESRCG
jgi:NAD(P)-dependent dehydrogenase (short-subunit alcohol dehydrogenase family)